jgi:hypothetical protein
VKSEDLKRAYRERIKTDPTLDKRVEWEKLRADLIRDGDDIEVSRRLILEIRLQAMDFWTVNLCLYQQDRISQDKLKSRLSARWLTLTTELEALVPTANKAARLKIPQLASEFIGMVEDITTGAAGAPKTEQELCDLQQAVEKAYAVELLGERLVY